MKIVFFGSDDFAARHLEQLLTSSHELVACVTPPDKARGRGMKVTPSQIKTLALENKISLLQPTNFKNKEILDQLKEFKADLFIVIAYGQILPQSMLDIPSKSCMNVHASLLPKYRGAAPINWAIIHGETTTGISIIQMNAQMDAGDILAQSEISIFSDDTAETLRAKMMETGPSFLLETMAALEKGEVSPVPQNEDEVTFAPKLTKELGRIDWTKSAGDIGHLVRGLLPWPTAYTMYKGKMLKILSSEIVPLDSTEGKPGGLILIEGEGFVVATGKDGLFVKNVHFESSKPMDAASFVRGHRLKAGETFA